MALQSKKIVRTAVKSSILKEFWALRYAQIHTNTCKYVQIRRNSRKNAQTRASCKKSTKRLQNQRKCNYIATSVLRVQRASERSELSARSDERRQRVVASDKKQRQATTCGDKQRPTFLLWRASRSLIRQVLKRGLFGDHFSHRFSLWFLERFWVDLGSQFCLIFKYFS